MHDIPLCLFPVVCVIYNKPQNVRRALFSDHMTRVGFVLNTVFIPPANYVCRGYTVFTLSVRASVRPSVTLCFLNNSKSHCWIFIKPCKHVYICKTNTLDKKVRARGQFY